MTDESRQVDLLFAAAVTILALGALGFRLYRLGGKEIAYDEGAHAWFSWNLLVNSNYQYSGYYHGPPLYYLSALAFAVANPSVIVGRALIAILSVGIYPCLYWLRDRVAHPVLLFVGIIYAFHPMVVWTSRFYRNDILTVVGLFLILVIYSWYRSNPSRYNAFLLGAVAITAAAPKELGYLLLPALFAPTFLLAHAETKFTDQPFHQTLSERFPNPRWPVILGVVIAFFVLYSGWPPNPLKAPEIFFRGVLVWVSRGSGEVTPLRYLRDFMRGAPILLVMSFVGVATTYLKTATDPLRWNIISLLAVTSVLLSFTPHQNKHLLTIIFVPLVFVAAIGIFDTVSAVDTLWTQVLEANYSIPTGTTAAIVVVIAAMVTGGALVPPVAQHIEGITQPPAEDPQRIVGERVANMAAETNCNMVLGPAPETPWPYRWYWRNHEFTLVNWKFAETPPQPYNHSSMWPAIVVNRSQIPELEKRGIEGEPVSEFYVYRPPTGC